MTAKRCCCRRRQRSINQTEDEGSPLKLVALFFHFFYARRASVGKEHSIQSRREKNKRRRPSPDLSFYREGAHFDPLHTLVSKKQARSDPKSEP